MKIKAKRNLAVLIGIVLLLTQVVGIIPVQPAYAEEPAANVEKVTAQDLQESALLGLQKAFESVAEKYPKVDGSMAARVDEGDPEPFLPFELVMYNSNGQPADAVVNMTSLIEDMVLPVGCYYYYPGRTIEFSLIPQEGIEYPEGYGVVADFSFLFEGIEPTEDSTSDPYTVQGVFDEEAGTWNVSFTIPEDWEAPEEVLVDECVYPVFVFITDSEGDYFDIVAWVLANMNINPLTADLGFGGETTDWTEIDDFSRIDELVFDAYEGETHVGKISFTAGDDPINICKIDEELEFIPSLPFIYLNETMDISQGRAAIDTWALPMLNIPAAIELYNINQSFGNFTGFPGILHTDDEGNQTMEVLPGTGELIGETGKVTGYTWDTDTDTVSLDVAGWSSYEVIFRGMLHVDDDWNSENCPDDLEWGVTAFDNINDAVSAAWPGMDIYVHAGEYNESVIVDKEHLAIKALDGPVHTAVYGGEAPAFDVSAANLAIDGFYITSDTSTGIDAVGGSGNLEFTGNDISGTSGAGIQIEGLNGANVLIQDNNITGNSSEGIDIESAAGESTVEIEGNTISGNYGDTVYFDEIYDSTVTIANNDLSDNEDGGIYIYEVSASVLNFTDNTISNNYDDGICIEYINEDDDTASEESTIIIEGNSISGNDCEGIYIYEMNNTGLGINNNSIFGNSCEGIYIYEMNNTGLGINNNSIFGNSCDGIYMEYLYNGNTVNIEGNTIYGHEWDEGIYVDELGYEAGDRNELNIINNFIGVPEGGNSETDANEDGIYVSDVDFDAVVTIEGNIITGNTGDGIILEYLGQEGDDWEPGSNFAVPVVTVRDNIVTENEDDGLYHYDNWQYGVTVNIENNIFSNNGGYGIDQYYSIEDGSKVTISNNEITGNAYGGIVFDDVEGIYYGATYLVENNTITGNTDYGLYLNETDSSTNVEIGQNNTISNNEGYGIYLNYYVTGVKVWGNIIDSNYEGIAVDGFDNEITGNNILNNLYDESGIHLTTEAAGNTINYNDIAGNGSGISTGPLDGVIGESAFELRDISVDEKTEQTCLHEDETSKKTKDKGDSLMSDRNVTPRTADVNDATLNWWGNPSGPTVESNVYGTGDTIAEGIPYSPWAAAAYFQEEEAVELNPGDTIQLTLLADTLGTGGETATVAVPSYTVRYTSSDPGIATVAPDGIVTAVGPGTAEITAHFADALSIEINVNAPPQVLSTTPQAGASGVAVNSQVIFTLSESVFEGPEFGGISIAAGETVVGYTYSIEDNLLKLVPESNLAYNTSYTVTLPADSIIDSDGLGMDEEYSLTFTTRSRPSSGNSSGSSRDDDEDTIVIPPVAGPVSPFSDVPDDHWAVNEIVYLYQSGIINGFGDNTFKPDNSITRAELAAMLAKALQLDMSSAAAEQQFSDVSQDHWAFNAVAAATGAGLMLGYNNEEFRPDAPIVREELALVMMRALYYPQEIPNGTTENLDRFNDRSQIPEWSAAAISLALETGLVQGITENSFGAGTYATRAQVAVMAYRMLNQRAGNQ